MPAFPTGFVRPGIGILVGDEHTVRADRQRVQPTGELLRDTLTLRVLREAGKADPGVGHPATAGQRAPEDRRSGVRRQRGVARAPLDSQQGHVPVAGPGPYPGRSEPQRRSVGRVTQAHLDAVERRTVLGDGVVRGQNQRRPDPVAQ